MNRALAVALATVVLAGSGALAEAASTTPNAAALATKEAKAVLIHLRDMGSGAEIGTMQLTPIGRTRTRVSLHFNGINTSHSVVTLHRGADCNAAVARQFSLNPVSSSSQVSQTIVSLPLTDLRSGNYLLDVHNQTQAQQFAQACAHVR
jgi:hypothetical protein